LSSEPNNDRSGIGQGNLGSNLRPATERRALEMKKEKNPPKEAFDATAFAKFFFGPGRWQTGAVLLIFGIPRDDSDGTKHGMNPGDEAQTPIGSVQADDTGTDLVEAHGPL
jgi:hypothetical protein